MSLQIFASKIQQYCRLSGYSRKALALALGLHPTLLSHKLNGTANRTLTYPEIKAIVKTLAEWEAITSQGQALELLELLDCPPFTPEEWRSAPLNRLEASRPASISRPAPVRETGVVERRGIQTPTEPEDAAGPGEPANSGLELIVGRAKELEKLAALYRATRLKQSQIVVISGEAGIGKSYLAASFCESAAALGAVVLKGRAFEVGGRLPYQPIVEAFRQRLEQFSGLDRLLSRTWLTELSRLFPELRDHYPDLPFPGQGEGEAHTVLFEAITRLVQGLARENPVVFYLDDVQWADPVTLDLLHYAARRWRETATPVLLLLTLRSEALVSFSSGIADWLSSISQSSQVTRLELNSLNREDTLQLVRHLVAPGSTEPLSPAPENRPADLLEKFGLWLYRETGGQPFFIMETLKALVEQGVLARPPEQEVEWSMALEITVPGGYFDEERLRGLLPNGVREVVRLRLAGLSREAGQLLIAGAVLGQTFDFERLCQIAGLPESEGLVALDELLTGMLLREAGNIPASLSVPSYIFAHDKIREVVYQEAGSARRQIFHRRALEALKAKGAPAATLAHHAHAAGLPEEASAYSITAGDEARRLFANVQARFHYGQALEILAHLPDTEENQRLKVDTVMKRAIVSIYAVPPRQSLDLLSEAEALARQLPGEDGKPGGDRQRLVRINSWLSGVYYLCGRMREAIAYSRQVMEAAQEAGDEKLVVISKSLIGRALGTQGYFGEARRYLSEARVPLQQLNNPTEWIYNLSYLASALAATGDWQSGLSEGQRALERAEQGHNLTTLAHAHLHLCLAYYLAGDISRMLEQTYKLVKTAEQSEDRLYMYIGYSFRTLAEVRLGQVEAAQTSLDQAKTLQQRLGQEVILADWVAAIEAEVTLGKNLTGEALSLAHKAVENAARTGGVFARGLAYRTCALALYRGSGPQSPEGGNPNIPPEKWDEIEGYLKAGVRAFEEGELVLEAARLQLTWGRLTRDKGDTRAAQYHLERALTRFTSADLPAEADEARHLLESLRQ